MIKDIEKDAGTRMKKSIETFVNDLGKVRTGRANASLLDHVTVPYYGSEAPLNQVASVTVVDPRTLGISPWEKNLVPAIEKAILNSDLGLNPVTAGEIIRVPLPPLTEERRKEMIRLVRQEAEGARVAVRNIRRDANNRMKQLAKDKEITTDEERAGENSIQELTDKHVGEIDDLLHKKEAELMEI